MTYAPGEIKTKRDLQRLPPTLLDLVRSGWKTTHREVVTPHVHGDLTEEPRILHYAGHPGNGRLMYAYRTPHHSVHAHSNHAIGATVELAPDLHCRITGIGCEQLQRIEGDDCAAEGILPADSGAFTTPGVPGAFISPGLHGTYLTPRRAFVALWDLHAKEGEKWADNRFVTIYTFELVEKPQRQAG